MSTFHYQHPVPYNEETETFDVDAAAKADKGMKAGFDSHFVSISVKEGYQVVDSTDYDYDEIVLKEAAQVLPIAIVHCR